MVEHKGWRLVSEEYQDGDRFWYTEHYAVRDGQKVHLHGSRFPSIFDPTPERFAYLVDHDFPRAPKGNWFNHELDELIRGNGDEVPGL